MDIFQKHTSVSSGCDTRSARKRNQNENDNVSFDSDDWINLSLQSRMYRKVKLFIYRRLRRHAYEHDDYAQLLIDGILQTRRTEERKRRMSGATYVPISPSVDPPSHMRSPSCQVIPDESVHELDKISVSCQHIELDKMNSFSPCSSNGLINQNIEQSYVKFQKETVSESPDKNSRLETSMLHLEAQESVQSQRQYGLKEKEILLQSSSELKYYDSKNRATHTENEEQIIGTSCLAGKSDTTGHMGDSEPNLGDRKDSEINFLEASQNPVQSHQEEVYKRSENEQDIENEESFYSLDGLSIRNAKHVKRTLFHDKMGNSSDEDRISSVDSVSTTKHQKEQPVTLKSFASKHSLNERNRHDAAGMPKENSSNFHFSVLTTSKNTSLMDSKFQKMVYHIKEYLDECNKVDGTQAGILTALRAAETLILSSVENKLD